MVMSANYAELYRRARKALEEDAETLLSRPLTTRERNLFRNCGTLTRLDSLGLIVYSSQSAEELTSKLAEISMDSRFTLALRELINRLEVLMERSITNTEREQLEALGNIEELWALELRLNEASHKEREAIFSLQLKQKERGA